MKIEKEAMTLYVVTDRSWLGDKSLISQVEQALEAGATFIQLREKELDYDTFVEEAIKIKEVTEKYNVPFVINDNVDVAIASGADGVHIGQNDEDISRVRFKLGADKIIGLSAHSVEEAVLAEKMGADYIGVGAMFTTTTKQDANQVSIEELKAIVKKLSIPIVAIGGIKCENVLELSNTGIDGIAVISAIFAEEDIGKATRKLLKLIQSTKDY